jgi:regulator of RNase E activity RraA
VSIRQTRQDVPAVTLDELRALDTCTVSNAIERLRVRLRNEGFTDGSVRCLTLGRPAMAGYAVTARIRTSAAPAAGHWYHRRMDFWHHIQTAPGPRIIVAQDVDDKPGLGAMFGEIQAHIAQALGCVGYVTNGVVRDLPGLHRTAFPSSPPG